MLTREQKIDFLKCCIAAYEDERYISAAENQEIRCYGFCDMLVCFLDHIEKTDYHNIANTQLFLMFPKFYKFSESNRDRAQSPPFHFTNDNAGFSNRAQVARQFLKQEYGITVPKKKVKKAKKAKDVYPFTCPMQ